MPAAGRLRYLEAAPTRTSTLREPQGQHVLVLLHAFPVNARMWEPQLALAEGGWRVIAPQMRGFDGGAGDPPASSIDDYAGDVVDLLDGLHIENAVIGGLSMGGYLAFALLRRAPRYIRGLILADTRPQADTPEGAEGRTRMLALVREKGAEAVADEMIPKLVAESTRRERPDVVARVRSLVLANSPDAIASAITVLKTRPDSTPLLASIHCPTLIVVGDSDSVTPPAVARDMQSAILGSELVTIERAGHLSSLEQPEAFNRALAQFLERRI